MLWYTFFFHVVDLFHRTQDLVYYSQTQELIHIRVSLRTCTCQSQIQDPIYARQELCHGATVSISYSFIYLFSYLEAGSHCVDQADLELSEKCLNSAMELLSQSPTDLFIQLFSYMFSYFYVQRQGLTMQTRQTLNSQKSVRLCF